MSAGSGVIQRRSTIVPLMSSEKSEPVLYTFDTPEMPKGMTSDLKVMPKEIMATKIPQKPIS